MTTKNVVIEPESESEFIETDFGERKVSHINQSRMVAIPKMALKNACGTADNLTVKISLVQHGKEKFLKLVPVCEPLDEDEEDSEDDE